MITFGSKPKLDANRHVWAWNTRNHSQRPTQLNSKRALARQSLAFETNWFDLSSRFKRCKRKINESYPYRMHCLFAVSHSAPMMSLSSMALCFKECGSIYAGVCVCCWCAVDVAAAARCRRRPRHSRVIIIAPTHFKQETSAMCHFQLNAMSFTQTRKSMFPRTIFSRLCSIQILVLFVCVSRILCDTGTLFRRVSAA